MLYECVLEGPWLRCWSKPRVTEPRRWAFESGADKAWSLQVSFQWKLVGQCVMRSDLIPMCSQGWQKEKDEGRKWQSRRTIRVLSVGAITEPIIFTTKSKIKQKELWAPFDKTQGNKTAEFSGLWHLTVNWWGQLLAQTGPQPRLLALLKKRGCTGTLGQARGAYWELQEDEKFWPVIDDLMHFLLNK